MTQTKKASIFITGATGNVGSLLVQALISKKVPFKMLIRESSRNLIVDNNFTEVVYGDLRKSESFEHHLQGVEKAFLLTNSSEEAEQIQLNFVKAAKRAGVKHIVKLSQYSAAPHSPVRFLRYHAAVEKAIKEQGLAFTFLRPNLYMQALLSLRKSIVNDGKFFAAVGNAPISAVDIRDIANVAAQVLTNAGHENKIYNITGPEALTHYQMAAFFSEALEKDVHFIDVSPDDMRRALNKAHFPSWQVEGLLEDYAHYARGEAAEISSAVEDVTGAKPHSFRDFCHDYSALFRQI
ncbi:SDR family oxidoreductase [Chryseosolibacter indicus]|uniref:SDR family oxidoreductase n=1 Tax=Chryseosolibacter indicus TaxID=2782351 RepID=A0ABS5VZ08_9BACT|nr:SDR family oxidoreductase [Chryseosolibacter indicus]MBT1706102.1 SDR family oxidoreductase [Chryseosolibacter indicus]